MDSWNEAAAGRKLTYDDFVRFPDDGLRHELIDGEHYVTPAPSTRHQEISRNLVISLGVYLNYSTLGKLFYAPFDVVLSKHDVVEPDVVIVLADQAILTPQHARGAPAIVIEILSPSTRNRDETLKRELYERAGVREYWSIDPDEDLIVIRRFGGAKPETLTLRRGAGQVLTSPLLPEWRFAVDVLLRREPVQKLTYDDFLGFPFDELRSHELIDGVHYTTPGRPTRHQRISGRLQGSLTPFLEASRLGEAFSAPVDVVLSIHDIVVPDLLVILADQSAIVTEDNVRGSPAVVVEILSDDTVDRDKTLKRALYERAGVREYWTVDPDEDVVVVQRFGGPKPELITLTAGHVLTSPLLPGWALPVDDLLAR